MPKTQRSHSIERSGSTEKASLRPSLPCVRFAPLVRVSTEKQEQQGESLCLQRKNNTRDVERIGGRIVAWYGGQEHATPGWERAEVDRLIADAARNLFDAVIVAYPDRWSRDNAKSKEGLEVFRNHDIKFYVGTVAKDLCDPNVRLELGIQAEIGEFFALQQLKKSLESKIERAMQGKPAVGDRPFGRLWDRDSGMWSIDPKAQAMVQDAANRLLQGEPLGKLAAEYGVAVSNLWKVMRHRCGDQWAQSFRCKALNIDETVLTTVPRLLDDATIRAVGNCLNARRTFLHRPPAPRHTYLLSGRVFCSECGYSMTGNHDDRCDISYYCHHVVKRYKKSLCNCTIQPRPRVRAEWLESEVIHQLFNMFGNPAQIERAVRSAVPDCDSLLKRRQTVESNVERLSKARSRILSLIVKGTITDEQAEKQLEDLKEQEGVFRDELYRLTEQIGNLPSEDELRIYVEKVNSLIFLYDDQGNTYAGGNDVQSYLMMSDDDRRRLIDAVFAKPLPSGKPAGVYISPHPSSGRRGRTRLWSFTIKGQLEFDKVISTKSNSGVPFSPCPTTASTNI
jgi:DNA invertase Pin-like site-specific DNA recombinase